MLIMNGRGSRGSHLVCPVCGEHFEELGSSVGVCPDCIRMRWNESRMHCEAIHQESRQIFNLPVIPPRTLTGSQCNLCLHQCHEGMGERGYCGVRTGHPDSFYVDGHLRAKLSHYFDPIPTNCVADWVCAGGTGSGYPKYAHDPGTEVGYFNLAVFFEACNFNCLFCQNWSFKKMKPNPGNWHSLDSLVEVVNPRTSCVCYFGGDPTPQLPFALAASEKMINTRPGQLLRICWETNGSMHPDLLRHMARLSLDTGGCIKVDLKAWNPNIHRALCGCDNRIVLENFAALTQCIPHRPEPPLLVASTLMVPGYVGVEEIKNIASFIAGLNPDIPYTLLAFAPEFCLEDFPTTSRDQAEQCLEAAKKAGLSRVRIGNQHLLGARL